MTKSTITREQLLKIIETDHVQCGEASYLARMALAAMDSEPDCKERKLFCSTDTARMRKVISVSAGTEDAPLYRHAQPVPVVPNEIKHRIGGLDWGWEGEFNRGWNACRAAMLQELKKSAGTEAICRSDENVQVLHTKSPAQSDCCPAQNHVSPEQNGDTPAQSQGWIPVSERMPEIGDIVLTAMGGVVNVGEMECSAANCRFFTSVISGRELPATHWMPLPAAPQEVK
ncbi:DUF551 domain-containing protein [Klebsiella quasipneumoniae]|nr:DUF551 domain-containing protein [Klebsiella quasipneumoniae]EKZ5477598.1 DUF551 domain-containing protein [Klebsiella quasipneumoniae]EKZ5642332.1 DUF551 domain-containing protein [Klebsiella quasipneumoniae]